MSDARWRDVQWGVASAVEHFSQALVLYDMGGFEGSSVEAYRASMAFMHSMQSAHTSLEGALLRLLDLLGEERPSGEHWHQDLIWRFCRPQSGARARPVVLSAALCEAIDETREFRNIAMRGYGGFKAQRARPAVAAARVIAAELSAAIEKFRDVIDGD
jgi:hypothetical protein